MLLSKRMNKKNVDSLLNREGDLVKGDRNQPGYKKKYFPVRTVRLWSWLLREAEQAPSLEVLKEIKWIQP